MTIEEFLQVILLWEETYRPAVLRAMKRKEGDSS